MDSMRRLLLPCLLLASSLAGCGGGGEGGLIPGDYVGVWSGNFEERSLLNELREAGTVSFSVSETGAVSGQIRRTTNNPGETQTFSGQITFDGRVAFNYTWTGSSGRRADGTIFVQGNQLVNDGGGTTLNLATGSGSEIGTFEFSIFRAPE